MNLDDITPLILTFNEAPNIERCLDALRWARRVVVVDSRSTDETVPLIEGYANAQVFERLFDEHSRQWSFGLHETGIETEWVLSLDADYQCPPELIDELTRLEPPPDVTAYRASFTYRILGHALRGNVYPPVSVLFRRTRCRYVQDGHTQRLQVAHGRTADLNARIIHDDRKSLARWLVSQSNYMDLEVQKLGRSSFRELGWADRLRTMILFAPWLMPLYCLLVRGGILDGWAGLHYAWQRMLAEGLLSLKLLERKLRRNAPPASQPARTSAPPEPVEPRS
jgi:glycosyltransferase involved in cell wall biosynthesis